MAIDPQTVVAVGGKTYAHMFCGNKAIKSLPDIFNNEEVLGLTDYKEFTPFHLLAYTGNLSLAKPSSYINLLHKKTDKGMTFMHQAVLGRAVLDLPKPLQEETYFIAADENKMTPIHYAAQTACLEQIPEDLRNRYAMLEDAWNRTPLQEAAYKGQLALFNKSVLTEANLMKRDKDGVNSLTWARFGNHLDSLLGIPLSKHVIPYVGEDWYNNYISKKQERDNLLISESDINEITIELF